MQQPQGLITMADKRFLVLLKDGSKQPVVAVSGGEDDEADGYVFFLDSSGGLIGLFHKEIVQSWSEDDHGDAELSRTD